MTPSAGYSGTPLPRKLGITEGMTVIGIDIPKDYAKLVAPLPQGARVTRRMPRNPAFVHVFATSKATLAKWLERLRKSVTQDGVVWVSWPKRTAGVETDITEDMIREVALPLGFVDVKVCAVDDTWSGLKLVIRREFRGK